MHAVSRGRRADAGLWWLAAGWAGFLLLPWYALDAGASPAALWGSRGGHAELLALVAPLGAAAWALLGEKPRALALAGAAGLAWLVLLGVAPFGARPAMGWGAMTTGVALLMLLCRGLAGQGWAGGDFFVTGAIGIVIAPVALFIGFPVARVLESAFLGVDGGFAPGLFASRLADPSIWGLACLHSHLACGVAWNTLFLAVFVGVASTLLGLAFALIALRSRFRFKGALRLLSVLPIITPPFVIGLAIILIFGRSGAATTLLSDWLGVPRSRWIYGFPGIALAQLLAFTPIAFLVLVGVVQGVSPTLEEAAQTLRAGRWTTFRTVTFPLLRPGLANAFLVGFIESMADFGNPLVLGGNFEVLSTKIFFAVVGAVYDPARAAVLAIVLLGFTLGAFWLQHSWVGKRSYATVAGKGDAGLPTRLPRRVAAACYAVALPWAALTVAIYGMILVGGFVRTMGRDYTPTLQHYATAFGVEWGARGLHLTGSAWDSFWTTIEVAAVSAPLTAAVGILTAWLLVRQRFAGRHAFEFATMLSFAIPGTVIGVAYIIAFNVPPIELTGTGAILVICFIFRNMPVGVRAGVASLSQIDRSLEEASLTLRARSFTTLRRIVLPLLRPVIVSAMVYSFVRAMTAVSAVIFLVTAQYNLATVYIVGRVEAGEFGLAIAYSSVLIAVMALAIALIQLAVGERRLGRRAQPAAIHPTPAFAGGT
jgi:iron(III) transport system permease protein